MRAVLSTAPGGPETLRLADLPDPRPGAGEVVVRVDAVGLNFFDTLIIADRYQVKPPRPFSPGGECAGVIEVLGDGVSGWRAGERVAAFVGHGACRERIAVPAHRLLRVPDGVSDEAAAGLTITYGTGLHALQDRAGLKAGETLAVLGATGGTGLAAVELGRLMGARVIACASSDDKLALARAHGADETLNYAADDLKEGLRRLTGGRGVDVVYDRSAATFAEAALRALAWAGRYLVIGFAAEASQDAAEPRPPESCDIRGVFWGEWTEREPARTEPTWPAFWPMSRRADLGPGGPGRAARGHARSDQGASPPRGPGEADRERP
jgi:NADPH2:quinone reductase